MWLRTCVLALVCGVLSSSIGAAPSGGPSWSAVSASPHATSARASFTSLAPSQGARRAQVGVLVAIALRFVWNEFVAPKLKEWAVNYVADQWKAHGRKVVRRDTGDDVETTTFGVRGRDTDGDGKADSYDVSSEVEDHDGDGYDDDPIDENAVDTQTIKADLRDEVERQDQWLRDHGR